MTRRALQQRQGFDGAGHGNVIQALLACFFATPAAVQHENVFELQPLGRMDGADKQTFATTVAVVADVFVKPVAQKGLGKTGAIVFQAA